MKNAINWFEIPAANFDRAVTFYNQILGASMHVENMGEAKMAFLPCEERSVGGAIVSQPGHQPGPHGPRVYLNGGENLETILNKVESAGGKVVLGKTKVNDEIGYWALFTDSEGNHVAVHSPR